VAETSYASCGDLSPAYQVSGEGAIELGVYELGRAPLLVLNVATAIER
jgi:hypothetical protein